MAYEYEEHANSDSSNEDQDTPNESQRREDRLRSDSDSSITRNDHNDHGQNNESCHHENLGPLEGTSRIGNQTANITVGGSCGNIATCAQQTIVDRGAMLGQSASTPMKPPSKDSMLVAATPSSATTIGETAESSVTTFPRSMEYRSRRTSRSFRRQYQILQSQAYLLLGTTSIGLILFLILTLPLLALLSLALMVASLFALIPVASEAIRTRYQLELEHPEGLLRYLPDSVRIMLTETTLHEFMTDTTAYMEYRHLLLYFVPGLQPDQLMNYINQLPQRHRDVLLQPGLGRLLPSIMERVMRMDNRSQRVPTERLTQTLGNVHDGDISISSLLTLDREDNQHVPNRTDSETEVTLLEIVRNLRHTLTGQPYHINEIPLSSHARANDESIRFANSRGQHLVEGMVDDPSVEVEATDSTEGDQLEHESPRILRSSLDNAVIPIARGVVVEPQHASSIDPDPQEELRRLQDEYEVEGRVLSEATSAALGNYSSQASTAIYERVVAVVETVTSWTGFTGSLTGLVAGGGSIALATFVYRDRGFVPLPFSVVMGSFSSTERNNTREDLNQRNGYAADYRDRMIYGLITTSAFGFLSSGLSFLIRNRVRAAFATNRANREQKPTTYPGKDATDLEHRED